MKTVEVTLAELADKVHGLHGEDSDWWKGYVSGIRRAAQIVEAHRAFEETCGG